MAISDSRLKVRLGNKANRPQGASFRPRGQDRKLKGLYITFIRGANVGKHGRVPRRLQGGKEYEQ